MSRFDPTYSVRDVLKAGMGGFGPALDKVIDTTEEERVQISRALAATPKAKRARGLCPVPGCERPGLDGTFGCELHRRAFDAQADEEAWNLALSILGPWVEATEYVGSDELTRVMRGALAEAGREFSRVLDERERANDALESA